MSEDLEIPEINSPQRGSKDGYLQLFFISRQQLGRIIEQTQGVSDPRVLMYTKFMISSITDDELRNKAWAFLMEGLEKIDAEQWSAEEKNKAIFNLCIELLGHITAFYDQFLGVTHRLRVGTV